MQGSRGPGSPRGEDGGGWSRMEFYRLFGELEASGFPLDARVRGRSRLYRRRIADLDRMIGASSMLGRHAFLEVEEELNDLRDAGIIDNPLFGGIRMIFYNLLSWHLEPRKFTRLAIEKWYRQVEGGLVDRAMPATLAFLSWLVRDLDNGPGL